MKLCASGKVILLGEHAVVYGRPALALGLPDALVLESCVPRRGPLRVRIPEAGVDETGESESAIGEALRLLAQQFPVNGTGCDAVIHAGIPFGAGLGSSAALSVLLIRMMASMTGTVLSDEEVRQRAHELEVHFHGHPSGLDDTVATYGGLCAFRRDGWEATPPAWQEWERISDRALRLPFPPPPIVIGISGIPRETRTMVEKVRRRWEADRPGVEKVFDMVGSCVVRGIDALASGDLGRFADMINQNQEALAGLGLSCPQIDAMIGFAREAGAVAVKLTGGGGGGCVFALAPGREERVLETWRSHGFVGWTVCNRTQEHSA